MALVTWPFPPLHLPCDPQPSATCSPSPGLRKREATRLPGDSAPYSLCGERSPSSCGHGWLRLSHLSVDVITSARPTSNALPGWELLAGSATGPGRAPPGRSGCLDFPEEEEGGNRGWGGDSEAAAAAERRASVPEPGARSPPVGAQDAAAVLPSFRPSVRRARPCGPSEAPLTGARPSPGDQLLQRHSRAPAVPTGMSAMDEEKGDVANGKCHFLESCCFRRFMIYFVLTTTCGGAVSPTLHVKKRRRREIRQFAPR